MVDLIGMSHSSRIGTNPFDSKKKDKDKKPKANPYVVEQMGRPYHKPMGVKNSFMQKKKRVRRHSGA